MKTTEPNTVTFEAGKFEVMVQEVAYKKSVVLVAAKGPKVSRWRVAKRGSRLACIAYAEKLDEVSCAAVMA